MSSRRNVDETTVNATSSKNIIIILCGRLKCFQYRGGGSDILQVPTQGIIIIEVKNSLWRFSRLLAIGLLLDPGVPPEPRSKFYEADSESFPFPELSTDRRFANGVIRQYSRQCRPPSCSSNTIMYSIGTLISSKTSPTVTSIDFLGFVNCSHRVIRSV